MTLKSTKFNGRRALLSFHDITINNFNVIDTYLNELHKSELPFVALLIIPHAPDASHSEIEQFTRWINQKSLCGYEIFLHGHTHTSNALLKRSVLGRIKNKINNNEAEFAGLNTIDTKATLRSAIDSFKCIFSGPILGFVAPTWFDSPTLKNEVFSNNIPIYESRFNIYHITGSSIKTIPISWFQNGTALFSLWSRIFKIIGAITPLPTIKIALHPIDMDTPEKRLAVINVCKSVSKKRSFVTYKSLFVQF